MPGNICLKYQNPSQKSLCLVTGDSILAVLNPVILLLPFVLRLSYQMKLSQHKGFKNLYQYQCHFPFRARASWHLRLPSPNSLSPVALVLEDYRHVVMPHGWRETGVFNQILGLSSETRQTGQRKGAVCHMILLLSPYHWDSERHWLPSTVELGSEIDSACCTTNERSPRFVPATEFMPTVALVGFLNRRFKHILTTNITATLVRHFAITNTHVNAITLLYKNILCMYINLIVNWYAY